MADMVVCLYVYPYNIRIHAVRLLVGDWLFAARS